MRLNERSEHDDPRLTKFNADSAPDDRLKDRKLMLEAIFT
jgi:hypothetical protein